MIMDPHWMMGLRVNPQAFEAQNGWTWQLRRYLPRVLACEVYMGTGVVTTEPKLTKWILQHVFSPGKAGRDWSLVWWGWWIPCCQRPLAGAFIVVTFILGLVNAYIAIAVAYTPASIVVVGHHPLLLGFVNFLLDIPYKLVETRCFGLCVLKGESVESIPFCDWLGLRNLKSGNLHFCAK